MINRLDSDGFPMIGEEYRMVDGNRRVVIKKVNKFAGRVEFWLDDYNYGGEILRIADFCNLIGVPYAGKHR